MLIRVIDKVITSLLRVKLTGSEKYHKRVQIIVTNREYNDKTANKLSLREELCKHFVTGTSTYTAEVNRFRRALSSDVLSKMLGSGNSAPTPQNPAFQQTDLLANKTGELVDMKIGEKVMPQNNGKDVDIQLEIPVVTENKTEAPKPAPIIVQASAPPQQPVVIVENKQTEAPRPIIIENQQTELPRSIIIENQPTEAPKPPVIIEQQVEATRPPETIIIEEPAKKPQPPKIIVKKPVTAQPATQQNIIVENIPAETEAPKVIIEKAETEEPEEEDIIVVPRKTTQRPVPKALVIDQMVDRQENTGDRLVVRLSLFEFFIAGMLFIITSTLCASLSWGVYLCGWINRKHI
ncbi:hypothetical protein CAPTEDRAFT_217938 [Capitella teleta]|uniref:Uncharacterized protein n=1 Tax=Capitella teleta TaxID=283909 RepID=R7UYB2_CAPTE|nr:hypothetical protein CAPTEDRAFT_217938 [Capitella teleta]|eukprot:ELU08421.1 hypothetical protein CAPTEDRAFT_217938 [Capitella teleta]